MEKTYQYVKILMRIWLNYGLCIKKIIY